MVPWATLVTNILPNIFGDGTGGHNYYETPATSARHANHVNGPRAQPKKNTGKLHPLPILTKPWDSIGMDFVGPFPESKGFNYLWVILCQMMSIVHLVPVHTRMRASELSWIYLREIV
jgi:hypothetical protein